MTIVGMNRLIHFQKENFNDMEKTIIAYIVATCLFIVFCKTKFANKWIFSKIQITCWRLTLLQLIGYVLLFVAVYISYTKTGLRGYVYHNTPILETIFFVFVALPLIIGLLQKKTWMLFTSFLSLGIPFLVLYINDEYLYYKRKHRFDSKEKIEAVVDVELPDFEVTDYEESGLNYSYRTSRLKIKFLTPFEVKTMHEIKNWETIENDYYYNYKEIMLWINKDFTHATITYRNFGEYFIPPYYLNR